MFTILDKKRYFEQLFRENYTRLYYYALSFLNDSELARDVVSNVFEAVWVGRDRLEFPVLWFLLYIGSFVMLGELSSGSGCVALVYIKK